MTIRTQEQIRGRLAEARAQRRNEVEVLEYDRCYREAAEGYKNIDATAKRFLKCLIRNIQRERGAVQDDIACYVAWKWMLGHSDADYFPGAHGKPSGCDPGHTYAYLCDQIESGEWDRMTEQALEELSVRKLFARVERKLQDYGAFRFVEGSANLL